MTSQPTSIEELRKKANQAYSDFRKWSEALRAAEVLKNAGIENIQLFRDNQVHKNKWLLPPIRTDQEMFIFTRQGQPHRNIRTDRFSMIKSFMLEHSKKAHAKEIASLLGITLQGAKFWMLGQLGKPDCPYKIGKDKSNYVLKE